MLCRRRWVLVRVGISRASFAVLILSVCVSVSLALFGWLTATPKTAAPAPLQHKTHSNSQNNSPCSRDSAFNEKTNDSRPVFHRKRDTPHVGAKSGQCCPFTHRCLWRAWGWIGVGSLLGYYPRELGLGEGGGCGDLVCEGRVAPSCLRTLYER